MNSWKALLLSFPSFKCMIIRCFCVQSITLKVFLDRLFCTWLTWVGLHVEVAAGGGRRGWGCGGRRGGRSIARPRALDHAALGGGGSVAVAGRRATIAAGRQAEGSGGNCRLHLTRLLLHGGMSGAWRHTRTSQSSQFPCGAIAW